MGAAKKVRGKVKLFAFPRSKTKKYSSSSVQSSGKLVNQKGRGGASGRAVVKRLANWHRRVAYWAQNLMLSEDGARNPKNFPVHNLVNM